MWEAVHRILYKEVGPDWVLKGLLTLIGVLLVFYVTSTKGFP